MQSLDEWLQYWLAQHPSEIVMGLERVRQVWTALGAPTVASRIFTVAGTNGKGSCVTFLDAMLRAGGYRVGRYTSPHLLRYNERVAINDVQASDAQLIGAFERIDAARAGVPLTYFEAGTLAALLIFVDADLDAVVLEVGLGGRLDAVNLIDADVALISSIGFDHQDILGESLADIAAEKAGICRVGRPVVIAMPQPVPELLSVVVARGAVPVRAMVDYSWRHEPAADTWSLAVDQTSFMLPMPALVAPIQLRNAAAAIAALMKCADRLPLTVDALRSGMELAHLPGRLQVIAGQPQMVLDVAHNPEAAQSLADWLDANPRPTRAVFSALADKDAVGIVRVLCRHISHWHLCGLREQTPRGTSAAELLKRIRQDWPDLSASAHPTPQNALAAACSAAEGNERVLVFGSFYLIAALLPALEQS